jgi:hypothetical protein
MPRASRLILRAVFVTTVVANLSFALADESIQWDPVDQSVSDLDLRATSTRLVEQGIGVYGQAGSLYRRSGAGSQWSDTGQPLTQQYQLRMPGVTAWLDRPDYLVVDPLGEMKLNVAPSQDGQFIDLIPPNTVFDLAPPTRGGFVPYPDIYDDGMGSTRINSRIDGWGDTPVTSQPVQVWRPMPRGHRLPPHLMAERASRTPAVSGTTGAWEQANGEASTDTSPPETRSEVSADDDMPGAAQQDSASESDR